MRSRPAFALAVASVLASACTLKNYTFDAAATDSSDATDAPSYDVPPGQMFSHCRGGSDCPNNTYCDTRWPGGLCTIMCSSGGNECPTASSVCAPAAHFCVPRCHPGTGDCAMYGAGCVVGPFPHLGCFPLCLTAPTDGTPTCNPGLVCDAYTGYCLTPPIPQTGREVGEPCMVPGDCRTGFCILEIDGPTPNGYLGGYCASATRHPPGDQFRGGAPLPTVGCPPGSAVFPVLGSLPGDLVDCYKTCTVRTDCRSGYDCARYLDRGSGRDTTNGVCFPFNCTLAGMSCPTGTNCHVSDGGPNSFCGP